jgi:hypothetical protein
MEGTMIDSTPAVGDARWPLLAYMLTLPPKGQVDATPPRKESPLVPQASEGRFGRPADSEELAYGQPAERMRDIATGHRAHHIAAGESPAVPLAALAP